MEKLQPILTHKFWIVFGLALILPPIGWWSARGELSQQIESRTSTLDALSIPAGSSNPNQSWIEEVTKRNKLALQRNQLANLDLWKVQYQLQVWPADIRGDMLTCKYRERHHDAAARQNVPSQYVDDYPHEVDRVWRIVEPAGDNPKVMCDLSTVPRIPESRWKDLYPSWQEIWDAQEDLWLLTSLFQVVRDLNDDAVSIGDSSIRKIVQIRLFGGTRKKPGTAAPAPGSSTGGPGGIQGLNSFGGGGGSRRTGEISADFSLNEEFSTVTTGGSKKRSNKGISMDIGMNKKTKKDEKKNTNSRYVDFDAKLPYRVRGFYMKVVIDHRRLPDLLAGLSEVKWPVEVIRVHQAGIGDAKAPAANRSSTGPANQGGAGGGEAGAGLDTGVGSGSAPPGGEGDSDGAPSIGGKPNRETVISALDDDNLVTVVVAGLMTLYNPVEIDEEALAAGKPNSNPTAVPNANAPAPTGTSTNPIGASPAADAGAAAPGTPATNSTAPSGAAPAGKNPTEPGAATPAPTDGTAPKNSANPTAPPNAIQQPTSPPTKSKS